MCRMPISFRLQRTPRTAHTAASEGDHVRAVHAMLRAASDRNRKSRKTLICPCLGAMVAS